MADQPANHLLDPITLLAGCGGDPILLRKMVDSFQARAPEQLAELRDAALRQDFPKLSRKAHQLRGMVSAFSTAVGHSIQVLEHSAASQNADSALGQFTTLAEQLGALSGALSTVSVADLERLSDEGTG